METEAGSGVTTLRGLPAALAAAGSKGGFSLSSLQGEQGPADPGVWTSGLRNYMRFSFTGFKPPSL